MVTKHHKWIETIVAKVKRFEQGIKQMTKFSQVEKFAKHPKVNWNISPDILADKMGILTHNTKFVDLFINQKYAGVYHFTTNDDEEMLRANDRVPGPIYVGDYLDDRWVIEQFKTKGDVKVGISYVNQMGDEKDNLAFDRDYVSANVSYAF